MYNSLNVPTCVKMYNLYIDRKSDKMYDVINLCDVAFGPKTSHLYFERTLTP